MAGIDSTFPGALAPLAVPHAPSSPHSPADADVIDEQAESEDEAASREADEEILRVARERLALADEATSEQRRMALEDIEFRAGNQWSDEIKNERRFDQRPCLVVNRLHQFVQQVTNDQRQNRPAIKVHALDDPADEETGKVIQGLIRHIEYNSNAETAYDTAFESAVTGGFGFFRLTTDYAQPDSFEQEILVKRIRDPFSVRLDPLSQEPDGSDAAWAFIGDYYSKDEFKAKWPEAKLSDAAAWGDLSTDPLWTHQGATRVVEYFYKELQDVEIHQLSTGETVRGDELIERLHAAQSAGLNCRVQRSRIAKVPVVHWCKINGLEILERTTWPGSFIPIIPVYGTELYFSGKRILEGIIRHAKDPQRMLNYWKSAETEAIALAPRAPFVVAEGQLEDYEEEWKTANRRNHAYLYYKPTTIAGQAAPPPQRMNAEPAIQAITQASMGAADDLHASTGVYPAAVGAQSNEVSGVAIQRRSGQSQGANFHFFDNLTRSMRHAGRIMVEIIPHIYDTARSTRIVGDDGTQKVVRINEQYKDENGDQQLYSMDAGRYGVTIDTGPSYATKRQEAAESMIEFSRAAPQVAQSCADLIVKNMDWPGAQDLADRLKKMLPPQLQDDGKQKDVPPMVQAQMQQMQGMIKQLSEHLNETTKIIETKKLELEHRERVEVMKLDVDRSRIQADIEIQLAKLGTQSSIALLEQEIGALKHETSETNKRLALIGIDQPIEAPNDFDPQQADGGNYAGVGHVGGSENVTGGESPGPSMETQP